MKVAKVLVRPSDPLANEFWEGDGLGVLPPSRRERCLKCLSSGLCFERTQRFTFKEQAELELIKSKMRLDAGEIWVDYPFVKDPSCLSNNRHIAEKVAVKVEKDLRRDDLLVPMMSKSGV